MEIMANNPACCTPDMDLQQVARMMMRNDCGAIPVVDNDRTKRLVGIITDRDIACRAVAEGRIPFAATVSDCMTTPVVAVTSEMEVDECIRMMEEYHVRRLPVRDGDGCCCGMVAQADIARCMPEHESAELLRQLSRSVPSPVLH
jgi:CBS domain-containing protein